MLRQQPIRKANRRIRGGSARTHTLDVRIRTSTARRRRHETVSKWVVTVMVLGVLSAGTFFGARAALDRFFFKNADYTLHRITFDLDSILTRDEALTVTGLREGINIFSVDLNKIEATFRAMPQVQDVRIKRELPDHLAISITAREPVAWVAAEGESGDPTASEKALLADASGYLMRPRHILPEYYHLPVIYGVKSDNIRDGESLSSEDLRLALLLIDTVARHPESLLRIRTLDISRGYCIEVVNDTNARILFANHDFERQLTHIQQLLAHCAESGRTLESVNLMVKRNTPVTFIAAAPPELPTKTKGPTAPASKTRRN